MRLLVCGGRDYNDRVKLWSVLDDLARHNRIEVVIEGDCIGADRLAGEWARERGVPLIIRPAEWKLYGRKAGPIRNRKMLVEDKPTYVVAFTGDSGTGDMVRRAKSARIPVEEISSFG